MIPVIICSTKGVFSREIKFGVWVCVHWLFRFVVCRILENRFKTCVAV